MTWYKLPKNSLDTQECKKFFSILNSPEYKAAKKTTPVQFIMKVGHGTHQGKGVEVLTEKLEHHFLEKYSFGSLCGVLFKDIIAQKYVANPLLIYNKQKFDFRVYGLIASTNPLIAFYRDGFVRVSLQTYSSNTTAVS